MSDINYRAVYVLSDFEKAIFSAENAVRAAQAKVQEATKQYRVACAQFAGVPEAQLQFPHEGCMAKGILRHVFVIKVPSPYGHHTNKCIFCGCDNVDSLC